MRWAVGPNGTATHIFNIPPEKGGIACGCMCPGCNEPLQAVNARLNVPKGTPVWSSSRTGRTVSPFFRHPSGHARSSCLQKASQLAALTLFQTQNSIEVPAPKSVQQVIGVSGQRYTASAYGQPQRLQVRRTVWSDHQSAFLELKTGEKVLVILHSSYTGESDSDYDGVITVQCDDPDIAGMPLEELLTKVVLNDEHTCWAKHWSSGSLAEAALETARAQAFEALDWLPSETSQELGDIPLTSESLLHLVIKQIISESGYIVTPQVNEPIEYRLPNGIDQTLWVSRNSKRINLKNIRLEHWMPGMVPDIYCEVTHPKGTYELLIEVRVTHDITDKKMELIKSNNLLCMEVDVRLFSEHGLLTMSKLRSQVLDRPGSKRWRYHPGIDAQRTKVHLEIAEHKERVRAAMVKEAQHERERQQELTRREAERVLRKEQYRQRLQGLPREGLEQVFEQDFRLHHEGLLREEVTPVDTDLLCAAMERAGYASVRDTRLWKKTGVMALLYRISSIASTPNECTRLLDDLHEMAEPLAADTEYLPLVLRALEPYKVPFTEEQTLKVKLLKRCVVGSLIKGEATYARSRRLDSLIAIAHPLLKPELEKPEGTLEFAKSQSARLKAQSELERTALIKARYVHGLTQLENTQWAQNLPTDDEIANWYTNRSLRRFFEDALGISGDRLAEILDMAYAEAKLGGSIQPWAAWVDVDTEERLMDLVRMLIKLKLVS